MSFASRVLISFLKLSGMKRKLAKGSQKTFAQAVSYNRKHPFVMPDDHKAIYEQINIQTSFGVYPCIKITQPDSCSDCTVLFTWGGGGLLNTWKSQLGAAIRLGRDAKIPVYYPIYPLATEHSLLDTMEMIVETYKTLLADYDADSITVIGVSYGGSQALDLITYINECKPEMEKPGKVICVSPGCVPITEEERKRMEVLENGDAMVSASFVYSFESISEHWGKYPDWVQHPTVGNYRGLRQIRFYYASNETLAFAVPSFKRIMAEQNVNASFYIRDNMFHAFAIYLVCRESKEAYRDILTHIRKETGIV